MSLGNKVKPDETGKKCQGIFRAELQFANMVLFIFILKHQHVSVKYHIWTPSIKYKFFYGTFPHTQSCDALWEWQKVWTSWWGNDTFISGYNLQLYHILSVVRDVYAWWVDPCHQLSPHSVASSHPASGMGKIIRRKARKTCGFR